MSDQQPELIPMRPGPRLRHIREARGLTVEQISQRIRVRERIIEDIEREETDHIAPVYLRGYVRAYAAGLGLDPHELDAETRAAAGEEPELRSVFNVSRRQGVTERWLKAGSYLVATALIAALVWQVTQQAVQLSEGRSPISQGAPSPAAEPSAASSDGRTDDTARNSHVAASIASLEKLKNRPVEAGPAVPEQAWSAIRQPDRLQPGESQLDIRVSADSWVEITDSSGTRLERDLLRAGNERSYRGRPPFDLMLGRATAVELMLDGEPVDLAPHVRGNVARLSLSARDEQDP